jgi:cell division protein ZipA
MPELRWILLVLGALLVAGLWWWELRRSRARQVPPGTEPADLHAEPAGERHEPTFAAGEAEYEAELDVPSIRVAPEERPVPHGDPPVVTLEDLPEDADRIELAPEPRRQEPMTARRDIPGSVLPEPITIADDERLPSAVPTITAVRVPGTGPAARPERAAPAAPAAAPSRPEVEVRSAAEETEARRPAAKTLPGRTASPAERLPEPRPSEPPSQLQKIVALRLVAAGGGRVEGADLRAALEAEGLRFGKYSIFHRQRADGRSIYSVASLLEPGSFDLDRMDGQAFPGVSLFAVFPGPLEAPQAFDELLGTARRLGERLGAVPQDERGAPLGAQRAAAIREELVQFQGLVDRQRARPGA